MIHYLVWCSNYPWICPVQAGCTDRLNMCSLFSEYFLTLWHNKILWAYVILSLPHPWNWPLLQGVLILFNGGIVFRNQDLVITYAYFDWDVIAAMLFQQTDPGRERQRVFVGLCVSVCILVLHHRVLPFLPPFYICIFLLSQLVHLALSNFSMFTCLPIGIIHTKLL